MDPGVPTYAFDPTTGELYEREINASEEEELEELLEEVEELEELEQELEEEESAEMT